jgi:hypothetical protein
MKALRKRISFPPWSNRGKCHGRRSNHRRNQERNQADNLHLEIGLRRRFHRGLPTSVDRTGKCSRNQMPFGPHIKTGLKSQREKRFFLHHMSVFLLCVAGTHISGCATTPDSHEAASRMTQPVTLQEPMESVKKPTLKDDIRAVRQTRTKKPPRKPDKPVTPKSSLAVDTSAPPPPSKPPAIGESGG